MSRFGGRLTAGLAGILIFCLTSSTSLVAAPAEVLHLESDGATAFFSNTDGCIVTAVFAIARLQNDGQASAPRTHASVSLLIDQVDLCAVVPIISGNGFTTDATIAVDPNLGAARVLAVVPTLNGVNGTVFDAVVDLTFAGTSAIAAENGQELSPDRPGYVTTFHRTFREATAVGSILGITGELAPDASIEATIDSARTIDVEIR